MFKKVIYILEGENGSYVGQTNSFATRLQQHWKSGLIETLTNSKEHFWVQIREGTFGIKYYLSNDPNKDERNKIIDQINCGAILFNCLMNKTPHIQ